MLSIHRWRSLRSEIVGNSDEGNFEGAVEISSAVYAAYPSISTAYLFVLAIENAVDSVIKKGEETALSAHHAKAGDVLDGFYWKLKPTPNFYSDTNLADPSKIFYDLGVSDVDNLVASFANPVPGQMVMNPETLYAMLGKGSVPKKYRDQSHIKVATKLNYYWKNNRDALIRPAGEQKGMGVFAPFDIPHGKPEEEGEAEEDGKRKKRRRRWSYSSKNKKEGTFLGFYLGRIAEPGSNSDAVMRINGRLIDARKKSDESGGQGEMLHWVGYINDSRDDRSLCNVMTNSNGALYTTKEIKKDEEFLMPYDDPNNPTYWGQN